MKHSRLPPHENMACTGWGSGASHVLRAYFVRRPVKPDPRQGDAEAHFRDAREIFEESREILERQGWDGLVVATHLGLLACTAHTRDWKAWDDHLERGGAALDSSAALDPDLAACAELAGRLVARAGQALPGSPAGASSLFSLFSRSGGGGGRRGPG